MQEIANILDLQKNESNQEVCSNAECMLQNPSMCTALHVRPHTCVDTHTAGTLRADTLAWVTSLVNLFTVESGFRQQNHLRSRSYTPCGGHPHLPAVVGDYRRA